MKVNFHLDKQNNPQAENGVKVQYGAPKRGGYRIRWYIILAIVISPVVLMAYYLFRSQFLITAPAIVTSNPITLTAPQTSAVVSIDVKIGSAVSKGQDLILLDNQVLNKEIKFIHEQLATLTYHNDTNTDVLYQQAIANTEQSVKKAESAQRKYDFYRAKGQVSDVDYTAIVNINNSLNSQLSSQKVAYEDSQRDLRQMQLAGPVAQAHRALMKELVVKQAEKERLTAKAPFDGRILDIFVKKGETVSAGAPLLTMTTNTQPEVVAFLKPKYLEYSQLGTKAKVTYPDGKVYSATVSGPTETVNKLPTELQRPFEGQPAYLKVRLAFDKPLDRARWVDGVEVEVTF